MNKEEQLHQAVCRYIAHAYPQAMFNTDLSGIRLTKGLARKVKYMRSGNGYPDLMIYEQRQGYNALFVELKVVGTRIFRKDGKLTANKHIREQAAVLDALKQRGFLAIFVCGLDKAVTLIDWYMRDSNIPFAIPIYSNYE